MRLSHVELTVPVGSLTDEFCADLEQLLVGVLGLRAERAGTTRRYRLPTGQAITLNEGSSPIRADGDDHVGLEVEPAELDRILDDCLHLAARDDRVAFLHVNGGRASSIGEGEARFRTFFVHYLLPVWVQLESRG